MCSFQNHFTKEIPLSQDICCCLQRSFSISSYMTWFYSSSRNSMFSYSANTWSSSLFSPTSYLFYSAFAVCIHICVTSKHSTKIYRKYCERNEVKKKKNILYFVFYFSVLCLSSYSSSCYTFQYIAYQLSKIHKYKYR